jgi:hypothetical protein
MSKLDEAVIEQVTAVVKRAADAAEVLRRKLRTNPRLHIRPPQSPWRAGGEVLWVHVQGKREDVGYNVHQRALILSVANDGYCDVLWTRYQKHVRHSSPHSVADEWLRLWRSPRDIASWIIGWNEVEVWLHNRTVGLERSVKEIERQQASYSRHVRGKAAIDQLSSL